MNVILSGSRLFRELALLTCLFLSEKAPSMRLHGPSSRLQSSSFDTMEFHLHRLSVLGVLTPSTVCTALDLPDVFQPGATYRVFPSGGSASRPAVPSRRWPLPSRRCPPKRYRRLPVDTTLRSAALRALLRPGIRLPTPRCLAIASVTIPSWGFPPPGSQSSHHGIA